MSAVAALRGYRAQFLYSLYFILSSKEDNFKYRLEGEEDLDILNDDNELLYAIQIKNLTNQVNLSDLISTGGTSFLRRFINNYSTAIPKLVSFGRISSELHNWKKSNNGFSKIGQSPLKKYNLSNKDWRLIKDRIELIEVNEEEISDRILQHIKSYTEIDPTNLFENLMFWLYSVAESKKVITQRDLIKKVEENLFFFSELALKAELYGVYLKPLHKTEYRKKDFIILQNEFHSGISARYEHILSDLDIARNSFLERILLEFKKSNVVVIQGASGQGKTTLAYRFAKNNSPLFLTYELTVQDNQIEVRKAIQLILSLTKNIEIPVLILINVIPNSTGWLQVVREFSKNHMVKFLVTIRHEDWAKAASVGIDFLLSEIEVYLSEQEAKEIYNAFNSRKPILAFTDFEELWIKLNQNPPLLEFIYTITQGTFITQKLSQQIAQVQSEAFNSNNYSAIELLRQVCLADYYSLKIEVSKLPKRAGIDYIIQRFEKEYLLRVSEDGKYLNGLHPVRSAIIVNLLFDKSLATRRGYCLTLMSLVRDEDFYFLLLNSFYENIVTPRDVLEELSHRVPISWSKYFSTIRAFTWYGIREYVDENRSVFDECYEKHKEAWILLLDIYHGNTFDVFKFIKNSDFFNNEMLQKAIEFNQKLSSKNKVFIYCSQLITSSVFPKTAPESKEDWEAFGISLFWIKELASTSSHSLNLGEIDFEKVFKNLDVVRLSKLMFGMWCFSPELNSLRNKYLDIIIEKLRTLYTALRIDVSDSEIHFDYIIDVINYDTQTSLNDKSMEIVDVLRYAFPDKAKYYVKGHGHKIKMLSVDYDDTHKAIPIENLPLDEWVNINATTQRLYEFQHHPTDWIDFTNQLTQWEKAISYKLTEFIKSAKEFFKNGKYNTLIPIADNSNFSYSKTLKEPQTVVDKFGIFFDTKKAKNNTNSDKVSSELKNKYATFFKSYTNFKTPLEHFILQSGSSVLSKIAVIVNPSIKPTTDFERISQINLFDAISKHSIYKTKRNEALSKYLNENHLMLNQSELLQCAFFWKAILSSINANKLVKSNTSPNELEHLKDDFEEKLKGELKKVSKKFSFLIQYFNNEKTNSNPVIFIDSDYVYHSLLGVIEIYNAIKNAVGNTEHTSIKYLMLQIYFSEFKIITTCRKRTIGKKCYEFDIQTIRSKESNELSVFNWNHKSIDEELLENFKLTTWDSMIYELKEIVTLSEDFGKTRLLIEHLNDIVLFSEELIDKESELHVKDHFSAILIKVQESFQNLLDKLFKIIEDFPLVESDYASNEIDREFWEHFMQVRKYIFPTDKGDEVNYNIVIDFSTISKWAERLEKCSESFGIFIFLLNDKYIQKYGNDTIKPELN